MKKWIALAILFFVPCIHAQTQIQGFAADPVTCDPTRGLMYYNTVSQLFKICTAINTWSPFAGGGGGSPGGTNGQIQYNNSSTFGGINGSFVTAATGAISLTAGATTTTPLLINSFSSSQTANLLDINNASSGSPTAPFVVRGTGFGSFDAGHEHTLVAVQQDSATASKFGLTVTNGSAVGSGGALSGMGFLVADSGVPTITGGNVVGDGSGNFGCLTFSNNTGLNSVTASDCGATAITVIPFTIVSSPAGQTADLFDISHAGNIVAGNDNVGNLFFKGSSSGTAKIGVAAATGTPCRILLPTASPGGAGQVLQTAAASGGDCQTSWAAAAGGGVSSFSGDGTIITNSASTGAVTATITGISGGIPYFNTTSSWNSSALLASTALMVGGGSGAAPTTGNGDFTYATHTLTMGASGIASFVAGATNSFLIPTQSTFGTTLGALQGSSSNHGQLGMGTSGNTAFYAWAGAVGAGSTTCTPGQQVTIISSVAGPTCGSPTVFITGSDYTNATTSPSNVTGLGLSLAVNQKAAINCHLIYQGSATTASMILTSTGPASPTKVTADTLMDTTSGAAAAFYSAATDGTTFGFTLGPTAIASTATDMLTDLHVGIINGANAGTWQLQANANGVGTITIKVGSFCTIQ